MKALKTILAVAISAVVITFAVLVIPPLLGNIPFNLTAVVFLVALASPGFVLLFGILGKDVSRGRRAFLVLTSVLLWVAVFFAVSHWG